MSKEKKEKKPKAPRKPKQSKQETILPARVVEVASPGQPQIVQEKVVLPKERKKLVAHDLLPLVEGLLIRVENLEKEVQALKK